MTTTGSFYQTGKRAVVIQFGKSLTKAGFDTESVPRAIFPTPELQSEYIYDIETRTLTQEQWEPILENLIRRIYFQFLHVVPSSRRVILIENELCPAPFRNAAAYVLFQRLRVPSIVYISEMITPLYLSGVSTGLIIDVGYEETRILPVCFGLLLRDAYQTVRIGSKTVNETLKNLLFENVAHSDLELSQTIKSLSEVILEDIKVSACYVQFELVDIINDKRFCLQTPTPLQYKLNPNLTIDVPADTRWQACEVLFKPVEKSDDITLPEACFKALQSCNQDSRPFVAENIILCGGTTQFKGFMYRIALELKTLIAQNLSAQKSWGSRLCINNLIFPEILRQWAGASVFGSAVLNLTKDNTKNEILLNDWDNGTPLPDWIIPPELQVVEASSTIDILKTASGK